MCEYNYFKKPENKLPSTACITRYIDDVLVINLPHFSTLTTAIYGSELKLTHETMTNNQLAYLDLNITTTQHNKCNIDLFDKTDSFHFDVVKFSHASSNVHSSLGYRTLYSQLIRYARIISKPQQFYKACEKLISRMSKHGYDHAIMQRYTHKAYSNYTMLFGKYSVHSPSDVLNRLINIA
jgi:hypothetical protein